MKSFFLLVLVIGLLLSGGTWREASAQSTAGAEILIQTDTYTPSFYRGKALPSGENLITAIAYPDVSGTSLDPAKLHYKWLRDGIAIPGYAGTGKRMVSFETSLANEETLLEVEIANPTGSYRAKKSLYVRDRETKSLVYEDNPVLGVLYNRAVPRNFQLSSTEATFRGVPYFFSALDSRDPRLTYSWQVGGGFASDTERLTVRTQGERGVSSIGLAVGHKDRYSQTASYEFMISFGDESSR